jgi:hypothetical protein
MGLLCKDDGWRMPDELWEKMEKWLPPRKAPPRMSLFPGSGSGGDECHPAGAAHGDAMERAQCYRDWFKQFGAPAFFGVAGCRGLRSLLA